jgi:benzylsuccinate CoA-transferase BbsE subunit
MMSALEVAMMFEEYRVLDLTDEKGLFCGKVLSDLGMDVIKIEKPGGDSARSLGPFFQNKASPLNSLFWFANNTNKRSITLNIDTADGRNLFKKLAAKADIVVESFTPGYLDSLGLGYAGLSALNPGIVVASITHFGQKGPYARFKGSDIVDTAMGGLMSMTGDVDRAPLRISVEMAYSGAALQAAAGILIALYHRDETGEGQHIDVSVQESVVVSLWLMPNLWNLNKVIQEREGQFRKRFHLKKQDTYPCKDGYISWELFAGEWASSTFEVVNLMDGEGMAGELKGIDWGAMDSGMEKVTQEQLDAWQAMFARYFLKHTRSELHEEAIKRKIMLMPVNTCKDIVENRQLNARGFWTEIEHENLGKSIRYPGTAVKVSENPWKVARRAPLIGEHNEDIYIKELGLSENDLSILKKNNII